MNNKISGIKQRFHKFQKTLQALKQSNITLGQVPYILKEIHLWWQITRNMKYLQGSWPKTLKAYIRIFEGLPKKENTPS